MNTNGVWRFHEGSRRRGKVLLQRHLWYPDDRQGLGTQMRLEIHLIRFKYCALNMPYAFWDTLLAFRDISTAEAIIGSDSIAVVPVDLY